MLNTISYFKISVYCFCVKIGGILPNCGQFWIFCTRSRFCSGVLGNAHSIAARRRSKSAGTECFVSALLKIYLDMLDGEMLDFPLVDLLQCRQQHEDNFTPL